MTRVYLGNNYGKNHGDQKTRRRLLLEERFENFNRKFNNYDRFFNSFKAVIMLIIDQYEARTFKTSAIVEEVDVYYAQEGFQNDISEKFQNFHFLKKTR